MLFTFTQRLLKYLSFFRFFGDATQIFTYCFRTLHSQNLNPIKKQIIKLSTGFYNDDFKTYKRVKHVIKPSN